MAPEVIKNTNIKLVHRLTSQDDRELVGSTMSASPLQMENMATYISGQALFTYEKLLRPFEIRVSLVEEHGESTPNDDELYEIMLEKTAFRELKILEVIEEFEMLKTEITNLYKYETEMIEELFHFDKQKKLNHNVLSIYQETCTSTFVSIMKQQNKLDLRFQKLLPQIEFVDKDEFTDFYIVIRNIGQRFQKAYKEFCFISYQTINIQDE